ncbi:MAG: TonB-dependent receptor [Betaproteobacteria bacterium]
MRRLKIALMLWALVMSFRTMACASCGCSLNSDWGTQGLSTQAGWSLDERYDYLNQNQLWSGTGKISPRAALNTINTQTNSSAEVEKFTKTQTLTSALDYNDGESWGVSLVVPYVNRSHSTLGTDSLDGYSAGPTTSYDSQATGMGDIRIIGRYYGLLEQKNFGVQLGFKLPTGKTNQLANDGVSVVDPGLQIGTGTTDLILGAYYHNNWNDNWGYFGQVLYQTALNLSTMAAGSYKPGNSLNLNVGVRYENYDWIMPTLQINSRVVKADSGDAADSYATGGTLIYLTPGAIFPVGQKTTIYSNIQIPIYQNVNGIQLIPQYIFSVGARFSFN